MSRRGARVLVTRAAHQQEAFCRQIAALDLLAISFPCIVIEPLPWQLEPEVIGMHDTVLFTSANAVDGFFARAPAQLDNVRIEAIGPVTAERLADFGQRVSTPPVAPYSSEAWLAARRPTVGPESVLIVTGAGGRGVLFHELRQRRLRVTRLDVYQRTLPVIDDEEIARKLIRQPPHIISVTSDAILHNFATLAGKALKALRGLPLVVNSERSALLAADYGFTEPPWIASPPGDQGQLQCLAQWKAQC